MKSKIFLIIQFCFIINITTSFTSFAQNYQWAIGFGGKGMERAWDIAYSKNNYLITGQFTDTLIVQDYKIASKGSSDIFIAAHGLDGKCSWVRTIGGKSEDVALSIDCDTLGNAYVTGYFTDTMVVDGITHTAKGWELYIAKYNNVGDLLWFKSYKGKSSEIGYGLEVSDDGNIWVAGWFQDSLMLSNNVYAVSYGGTDIFNAKFDTDGNPLWIRHAGRESVDYGYKVSVDASGNSYITGVADYGSLFGTDTLKGNGAFIACYDNNGNEKWVNNTSADISGNIGVNSISVNDNSIGYICGRYLGTANFGSHQISSYKNTNDPYFASFNLQTGEWLGSLSINGSGNDKNRAVFTDNDGNAYIAGSFNDSLWINNSLLLANNNSEDIFAFKYNASTQSISLVTSGSGNSTDAPTDILIDDENNVIVGGFYTNSVNIGTTTLNSTSASDMNYFMYKVKDNTQISVIDGNERFKFFPNPIQSGNNLKIENANNQNINCTIVNAFGATKTIQKIKENTTEIIKTNDLEAGIYFVIIKENNQTIKTEKLIVY